MFKKAIPFLAAIFFSILGANALNDEMELLDGDFGFILNNGDKTAIIKKIYIPAHTQKDIVVPKYVTFHGDRYLVTDIQENATKEVIHRIKSFMAREDFVNNERNFKALTWLVIYNLPFITVSA